MVIVHRPILNARKAAHVCHQQSTGGIALSRPVVADNTMHARVAKMFRIHHPKWWTAGKVTGMI